MRKKTKKITKRRKTLKGKKNFRNKKSFKNKKNIKRGGGEEIDLRQILLTKPIIDAIKEYNDDIDLSQFKLSNGEQGFPLKRMQRMMVSDFDVLIQNEPVELKIAKNNEGKMMGLKIDGIMKKLYEFLNGRHRIARAIIDGRKTINANIL
jgi:hypothetical protein